MKSEKERVNATSSVVRLTRPQVAMEGGRREEKRKKEKKGRSEGATEKKADEASRNVRRRPIASVRLKSFNSRMAIDQSDCKCYT